jgi:hypothetical protein
LGLKGDLTRSSPDRRSAEEAEGIKIAPELNLRCITGENADV